MSNPKVDRAVGPDAIFISYRRGDTAYPASWLYQQLVDRFGADQVFKDVDSIELGSDFVAEITTAVSACHCLLALIGRDWLTAVDGRGRRRLDDPADFVRIEIEAALARDVRVIPVLVEDATMPYADELPPTLAPMTRRQALVLSPTRFSADIAKLVGVLERTFAEAAAARETAFAAAQEETERQRQAADEAAKAASAAAQQEAERQRRAADVAAEAAAAAGAAQVGATRPSVEAPEAKRGEVEPAAPPSGAPVDTAAPIALELAPAAEAPDREAGARLHLEAGAPVAAEPEVPTHLGPAGAKPDVSVRAEPDEPTGAKPDEGRDAPADPAAPAAPAERANRRSRRSALLARGLITSPVLFLIALLLPWTKDLIGLTDGFTRDGFSSWTLVLAWMLLLAAAGWVLLPSLGVLIRTPFRREIVTLGLTGLALVASVVGFLRARSREFAGASDFGLARGSDRTALAGAYLGLLVALVTAVLAVLLLVAGRTSADKLTPSSVEAGVRRRYAAALATLLALAIVGVIAHPLSADDTPAPYDGERAWWSSYGNDLWTTLTTSEPFDLSGGSSASLTAQANFYLEDGYDYLFGEVSTDDGATWTNASGIVNGGPIWTEGAETEGLTDKSGDADENGQSDWVQLSYDLGPWIGQSQVWFRFRYTTDSSYVSEGVFLDSLVITGDSTELLRDGAEESGDGPWTADGFVKAS